MRSDSGTNDRNLILCKTTAHTLCFTFALLALYPDEQEKLYEHIKSILVDGADPVIYLHAFVQDKIPNFKHRPTNKCRC